MFKKFISAAAVLAFAATSAAQATTSNSATFTANLSVVSTCSITGVTNINFGSLPARTTQADTVVNSGSITYSCSGAASPQLALTDNKTTNGADANNFVLANGSNYALFTLKDGEGDAIGNSATSGAATDPLLGTTTSSTVALTATIPASTLLVAGTYSDSITATINFS